MLKESLKFTEHIICWSFVELTCHLKGLFLWTINKCQIFVIFLVIRSSQPEPEKTMYVTNDTKASTLWTLYVWSLTITVYVCLVPYCCASQWSWLVLWAPCWSFWGGLQWLHLRASLSCLQSESTDDWGDSPCRAAPGKQQLHNLK